ncbi:site-specific DNA-methyltransferase (adenine-specific) [Flexibacter flexilis DSM 6793]|uniref:site-specific DNA-methyltransferase (adenine-specific) n=1 Tax=Flexibacter flexilis DSM 6793 TaxID=927664 RepID=A0A1I1M842_9BACT|nr:DNA methyltransferase [Flexibacter flexilis]SFC81385.1 site-specific DNA-methyltransferase (adenine-specific) [Flexibacter flexilis DSM 6793]
MDILFEDKYVSFVLGDNKKVMSQFGEKVFDLACCDPPYGIGQNWKKDKHHKHNKLNHKFNDSRPDSEYIDLATRISTNQIFWGWNYYCDLLPPTNNLIFWDKGINPKTQHGSAGELAYTSITKYPLIKYEVLWNGCVRHENYPKIHPHQKPVQLYKLVFNDFAKPGERVIDPNSGSGASAIAAREMGLRWLGIKKDLTFLNDSIKWYKQHFAQLRLA